MEPVYRKPVRLKGYDYSSNGAYFLTLCAKGNAFLFGHVVGAGTDLWQRSYHDHIIRNDADCLAHWQYITANPATWPEDEYFSETTN